MMTTIIPNDPNRLIILPCDSGFGIDTFSPDWKQVRDKTNGGFCFVGRGHFIEAVPFDEVTEYLEGGEYNEQLAFVGI